MESLFLLGFSEEEFLIALAMASSEAFFNKLLVVQDDAEERIINVDLAVGVVDEAHIA